jgi:hypothetical protein
MVVRSALGIAFSGVDRFFREAGAAWLPRGCGA